MAAVPSAPGSPSGRRPPRSPFLDGPAAFTVGLAPIPEAQWLTPDWEAACLPEKAALIQTALVDPRQAGVFAALPESEPAGAEAARLVERAVGVAETGDLLQASRAVSDDLVVVQPLHGQWTVTALTLCAPTFFSAAEAIGRDISLLHGPVPDRLADGAQGLGVRISRVFSALRPDLVLERHNWTVQPGPDRYAPASAPLWDRIPAIPATDAAAVLHLRVERQTIRRLPESGGVLFTIRVSLDPLASLAGRPDVRAALRESIANSAPEVRRYKKWDRLEALLRSALG